MTKWNDRAIQGLNPVAKLPDRAMVVCHRPDARGTAYVFADYLSKVSPEWAKTFGWGTWVSWSVGYSGNGNQGGTDLVQQSAGAIAYVELASYALENTLPVAPIMTRQGTWVEPDISNHWWGFC